MNSINVAILLVLIVHLPWCVYSTDQLSVKLTLIPKDLASSLGAYCLDGSLPGYYLHRGSGSAANNWLLQFQGGGWCNDIKSCLDRAKTRRGSTKYLSRFQDFSGILSNDRSLNPDFYNWNRVTLKYCDGASFAGDGLYKNGTSLLYFRGQKNWEAIIRHLLPQGLVHAQKALLAGGSAGGLAAFLHCDNFHGYLPKTATVKCMSDAGLFLDVVDISQQRTMRSIFKSVVSLQGVEKNLDKTCTSSIDPYLCFFPQNALKYIRTPFFILNSAYDVFQIRHGLVPTSADASGHWTRCKKNPAACNPDQINVLQGLRNDMISALKSFYNSSQGGIFINSCFSHGQSNLQDTWLGVNSPKINNKTIAEAVGDWYFDRKIAKDIDCPYPCDKTCHNIISSTREVNDKNLY